LGAEKPGILDAEGGIRDLSGVIADIAGDVLTDEGIAKLRAVDPASLPKVAGSPRIGACVGNVRNAICIGLNYSDHAKEAGLAVPAEPIVFQKSSSAICGPNDNVEIPRGSKKTDWEVELCVVIGKRAKYISEETALDHVAGYCVANDVSERAFQSERGGQWTKGKSHETFGPIGPWLVTRDEVPNPQALDLWLEVDGVRRQNGNTKNMLFGVATIISYLSQFMTLLPGDLIMTGTPAGVGLGQKPEPVFLKPGQTMKLGIEGLGVQEQTSVQA